MIINGEGGIGKSYLISVIYSSFKGKCIIIVIIGKVFYNVSGIIIYFFLNFLVILNFYKDLFG